jgi:Protein of unknown function (DUF1566)
MKQSKSLIRCVLALTLMSFVSICVSQDKNAATVLLDGKEWARCSLGQVWNGNTCIGTPTHYSYEDTKNIATTFNNQGGFNGKKDWRVPTVRELASLRVCNKGFFNEKIDLQDGGASIDSHCGPTGSDVPTLDKKIFPNTGIDDYGFYWTSSPYIKTPNAAWVVIFFNGLVANHDDYGVARRAYVRLVR